MTLAQIITNPAFSAAIGLGAAFILWAIRNAKKLAELDTPREWAGILMPALTLTAVAYAADPTLASLTLLGSFLIKVGVGMGWNGKALLPTKPTEPEEATP
jgi:hypothetical protein